MELSWFMAEKYGLAGLGASPGWFCKSPKPEAIAFYLAGLGASPGWFSKSPKPWSIALRLDFDLKGRDPTARSEGPVLASGKSLVQA